MLTRLKFKKDFRLMVRFLSKKPPENDGKLPEVDQKLDKSNDTQELNSYSDKIQSLLKSMIEANKSKAPEMKIVLAPIVPKKKKQTSEKQPENIEETITTAASEVAKSIGGDVKQTEAELLSKVLGKINQTPTELSKLLVGMKVNRSKETDDTEYQHETRGQQVKRLIRSNKRAQYDTQHPSARPQRFKEQSPMQINKIDLFIGEPGGIFTKRDNVNYGPGMEAWEEFEKRELTLATAQPPSNYFQKMILWTEQGKVWKFPINNEQGLENEDKVSFTEHIFLDAHLEGWCPEKGPVRHFMELVCTGLSMNPFYTVQEKIDHIMWYKEYFESKQDVLTEVGAWKDIQTPNKQNTNP